MNVSSATSSASAQVGAIKKATEGQGEQVLKILEGISKQSQQISAQKTGLGTRLNVSA